MALGVYMYKGPACEGIFPQSLRSNSEGLTKPLLSVCKLVGKVSKTRRFTLTKGPPCQIRKKEKKSSWKYVGIAHGTRLLLPGTLEIVFMACFWPNGQWDKQLTAIHVVPKALREVHLCRRCFAPAPFSGFGDVSPSVSPVWKTFLSYWYAHLVLTLQIVMSASSCVAGPVSTR